MDREPGAVTPEPTIDPPRIPGDDDRVEGILVPERAGRTEQDLAVADIPAVLADIGAGQRASSEGAVAAAIALAGVGAFPRSLTFLAAVIRSGGLAYTLGVPELMPAPEQAAMVRTWLEAAGTDTPQPAARDDAVARWLDAVAVTLLVRRAASG
jgi:hypothetical protein